MNFKIARCTLVAIITACLAGAAGAQELPEPLAVEKTAPPATAVETVAHGAAMGAFTGLTAGWVRYADEYNMQNVWKSVGYGAVIGLGAGITAAAIGQNGTGNLALTDIEAGGRIGGGIGFMTGIVSALFTGDSSRVGSGFAWGQVGGTVLGLGLAGYRIATHQYTYAEPEKDRRNEIRGTVELREDSAGRNFAMVRLTRRF